MTPAVHAGNETDTETGVIRRSITMVNSCVLPKTPAI